MIKKSLALAVVILIATAVAVAGQPFSDGSHPASPRRARPAGAQASSAAPPAAGMSAVEGSDGGTPPTAVADPTGPVTDEVPVDDRPSSPGGDIEHQWFGDGRTVAVLGDSLTVQARRHLRRLLADDALKVAALFGEGMAGGPLSDGIGSPIMAAVVREYAEDPPDVVVVALGTNDVWQTGLGPVSFERAWTSMTRTFEGSCIVGVTVSETTEAARYDAGDAATVNRVIRRTADVVVDWAVLGSAPRYTGPDHIHLTDDGQRRFAELIARGVDRCEPDAGADGR